LHSGDTGFNRVASLQDKQINWGKTSSQQVVAGGGWIMAEVKMNTIMFKKINE
jgi:hypothetical protein